MDTRTQSEIQFNCPVEAILSIIAGKYKCIILYHLINRTLRFSELRRYMPNTTPKVLTQQLRELEHDGVILRKVYPVVPPKTEYSLTEKGKTLIPVLETMCDWGRTYMGEYIKEGERA